MRLLSFLLQGLLIAWSVSCVALLVAIASVYGRHAVLRLWRAVAALLRVRAVRRQRLVPH
jgi:hypothetical protein